MSLGWGEGPQRLLLLDILFLRCAVPTANALVVAGLERVSWLECPEERWLGLGWLLLREVPLRAVSFVVGVERAPLLNGVGERLITVHDLGVEPTVLGTLKVLCPLVGILRVTNLIETGEWLGLDSGAESGL